MARQIFRKEALDRLASPEQLDQLMQVTSPRAWISLAAVGLFLLMVLLWAIFGTIPTTVEAPGILLRSGGVTPVEAKFAATVTTVSVRSGDEVKKDQELLRLVPETPRDAPETSITSLFHARVLQRPIGEGDKVKQGDPLMVLEPLDVPLEVRLFMPVADGYQIQRDMEVRVWPAQVNRSEYGYLIGKVRWAVKFPITQAEIQRVVQNEDQAHQLAGSGPCLQIGVDLTPDSQTVSGYKWSSSRGAPVQLYSGTPCEATVILGEQRPIQLVFPGLGPQRGP